MVPRECRTGDSGGGPYRNQPRAQPWWALVATVLGNLSGWDATDRLGELSVPTLITGGRHDEARPEHLDVLRERIVGSELVIFERSSHMAFVEERKRYMKTLNAFMRRVEAAA